jgi:hypothetical protein
MADLVAVLDKHSIFPRQDAERDRQTLRKHPGLLRSGFPWFVEHQHLVPAALLEQRFRSGGVFVGIHRVFQRGHRPHPPGMVPCHGDRLADAFTFGRHQFNLVTCGQLERCLFIFGRAFVARRPCRRSRCGWQFLQRDVLELDQELATAVGLHADQSLQRNLRIWLGIIERGHAIDPRADPRAFATDAVVVPIPIPDNGGDRGGIDRFSDDLVSTGFIVDLAPPTDAGVHLVARHLVVVRHPDAADLDARVHESRAFDQTQLEPQLEVCMAFVVGEKRVLRNDFLQRAAGDHAVLDPPPLFLAFADFPTLERLAVEYRYRCGSHRGEHEDWNQENGFHGVGWLASQSSKSNTTTRSRRGTTMSRTRSCSGWGR